MRGADRKFKEWMCSSKYTHDQVQNLDKNFQVCLNVNGVEVHLKVPLCQVQNFLHRHYLPKSLPICPISRFNPVIIPSKLAARTGYTLVRFMLVYVQF
jgi:hypothetical protein